MRATSKSSARWLTQDKRNVGQVHAQIWHARLPDTGAQGPQMLAQSRIVLRAVQHFLNLGQALRASLCQQTAKHACRRTLTLASGFGSMSYVKRNRLIAADRSPASTDMAPSKLLSLNSAPSQRTNSVSNFARSRTV